MVKMEEEMPDEVKGLLSKLGGNMPDMAKFKTFFETFEKIEKVLQFMPKFEIKDVKSEGKRYVAILFEKPAPPEAKKQ